MSTSLERVSPSSSLVGGSVGGSMLSRRTQRCLASIQERTLLQLARVQAEGLVQSDKVRELDHLGVAAMNGQALLRRHGDVLAGGDPFIAEDNRFFTDMIKLGKGEIIADTIRDFAR